MDIPKNPQDLIDIIEESLTFGRRGLTFRNEMKRWRSANKIPSYLKDQDGLEHYIQFLRVAKAKEDRLARQGNKTALRYQPLSQGSHSEHARPGLWQYI
jgi:hypothetical protein